MSPDCKTDAPTISTSGRGKMRAFKNCFQQEWLEEFFGFGAVTLLSFIEVLFWSIID